MRSRRSRRHVAAGNRITVHGDYDVDGVCATAIMVRALRSLGASVDWFLPGRIEDGYGLQAKTVARLAARGTRLLITVDCAITAVDEVALARATRASMSSCTTTTSRARTARFRTAASSIPPSAATPSRISAAPRVAHKLTQALGATRPSEDLELVALATVADLMPLRGENRRLVRAGLTALANTAKPGLRALMAVSSADPSALDAHALGFRLGTADQRRRPPRPSRCRARAAAHRRRGAGAGDRRPSSTASTASAGRWSSGSPGRPRRW